jgi:acetyltransferase-like isoleucine patch superfamily enzyme
MANEFYSSTQKELLSRKKSVMSKYSDVFLGRKSFWVFLKYEVITFLFSWVPGAAGFALRRVFYRFLLKKVGRRVVFGRNITLRHPHKIFLGDNCLIDDNVVLDAKGEENEGIRIGANVYVGRNTILSCKEGSIYLDDYCNISSNCSLLSETEIRLGKHCFLAGHCYLVAGGNHVFDDISTPIMFQPSISKGGIKIGDDVWLAAGVIVLDGVSLGNGCVIGAGSVVHRSLPAYTVALGNPVQKIKVRGKNAESGPVEIER